MARRTLRDPLQEQRWRRLLQDWKTSGLSRSQFCRTRQLSVKPFDFWRQELARRDAAPASPSLPAAPPARPVLLPITITSSAPLKIHLINGTRITVPTGFDLQHLQAVLQLLEGKPC